MSFQVPLFDLNYDQAEEEAILKTLRSKWISTGPATGELESLFAQHLGVPQALAVSSCTAALHIAMILSGVKPGDEVIVPSLTFVATANAIRYMGGTPVFADIESLERPVIDPQEIEKKITPQTKAIAIVHYAGFACEMEPIMALARKHDLKVIEDCAHVPDAEYAGKKLGTFGDYACFSFFSNKNITCGEGGMLITPNDESYQRAKYLRAHGMTTMSYERSKGHASGYDVLEMGYNYRIDDIRSSLLLSQMRKLGADIEKREYLRERYLERLSSVEEIVIPFLGDKHKSSHYIFPVVVKETVGIERDQLRKMLSEKGVSTSVHYPSTHRFRFYSEFSESLPKTEVFSDREVTLPLYFSLKEEQIDYVVESLKEVFVHGNQ